MARTDLVEFEFSQHSLYLIPETHKYHLKSQTAAENFCLIVRLSLLLLTRVKKKLTN